MNIIDLRINSRRHEPPLLSHPVNQIDLGLTFEPLDDRRTFNNFSIYHIHAHGHPTGRKPPCLHCRGHPS